MTRLAQISDLHFGAESPGLPEALLDSLSALKPDAVIASGDFTQYGRRREFDAARDFFSAIDAPVIAAPGNHDTPYLNLAARVAAPWARFEKRLGQGVTPSWRSTKAAVESFLTARGLQAQFDWSLGRANPKQAAKIAQSLSDFNGLKVVAAHHPLVAPGGLTGRAKTHGGREAAEVFVQSGVDLVVTGHLHQVFALPQRRPDGKACWFVGAGTALSHRTRGEPPSFNLFDNTLEGLSLTVYAAQDGENRFAPVKTQALHG
jgi:3',5'-cyclic AMP phosphodiesterase CpdA